MGMYVLFSTLEELLCLRFTRLCVSWSFTRARTLVVYDSTCRKSLSGPARSQQRTFSCSFYAKNGSLQKRWKRTCRRRMPNDSTKYWSTSDLMSVAAEARASGTQVPLQPGDGPTARVP